MESQDQTQADQHKDEYPKGKEKDKEATSPENKNPPAACLKAIGSVSPFTMHMR